MNVNEIKRLSTFLSKNTDIKQSKLLELFANYEGHHDWNTLVGTENKSDSIDSIEWDDAEFYDDEIIIGKKTSYILKYNFNKSLFLIKMFGHFGNYTKCIFQINLKDMKKCLSQYERLKRVKKEVIPNKDDSDIMIVLSQIDSIFREEEKRESECTLCEHGFKFKNKYSDIRISNRENIEIFFKRIINLSKNNHK